MKKCVTLLLMAALLLGSIPFALATETETETQPEQGFTVEGEGVQVIYPDMNQVLEDLGILMPDEDYDWEAEWAEQIRQEKIDMGMPYPDGINVSLNGTFLDFDGVTPVAVENRTMVPLRAFLEGAGATVDYTGGQIAAKLPNGNELALAVDSTEMTYTAGDKINKVEMGVAPYAAENRVYIPVRFAADALGLDLVWDPDYQVVHLTDWAAIATRIDEDFTSMNAILSANQGGLDPEKTYSVNLNGQFSGSLYAENRVDTASLTMGLSGLISKKATDLSMSVKLNQGGMKNTVFAGALDTMGAVGMEREGAASVLDALSDFRMDVRSDFEGGKFWVRGNRLSQLPNSPLPDNTWLEDDGGEGIMNEMDMLLGGGNDEPLTVGGLLTMNGGYGFSGKPPCANILRSAEELAVVLGDEAFTVTERGGITTYTNAMDMERLLKSLDGKMVVELFDAMGGMIPGFDWTFTVRLKDGDYLDGKFTANMKVGGTNPVTVTLNMNGTPEKMSGTVAVKGTYGGKCEFKLNAQVKESTRTVPNAPAEGEKVERAGEYD